MNALREYSNQMNTIIDTINSIAGSTGMLALNASIVQYLHLLFLTTPQYQAIPVSAPQYVWF